MTSPLPVPSAANSLTLTAEYEECVRNLGLADIRAQVFWHSGAMYIKTAPEVPAGIHEPCFSAIGGSATPGVGSWAGTIPLSGPSTSTATDGSCSTTLLLGHVYLVGPDNAAGGADVFDGVDEDSGVLVTLEEGTAVVPTGNCEDEENGDERWEVTWRDATTEAPRGWMASSMLTASMSSLEGCGSGNPGGFGEPWTLGSADDGLSPPVGLFDVIVSESAWCTTVTITFGDRDGPAVEVPGGIEVDATPKQTRLVFPGTMDLSTVAPASRAFWDNGAAIPVIDGPDQFMLIVDGSGAAPIIDVLKDPARLTLGYPSIDAVEVVTLSDTFIVEELSEVRPGRVRVSGWGAAFEAHAGVGLVDIDGEWFPDGWWVEGGTSTFGASIRMGNPGVAWGPFSFDIVGLSAGNYGLYLDSCGGQCEDKVSPDTVSFTVSAREPVEMLLDPGPLERRDQHAMIALPDGRIMIWGGLSDDGLGHAEYVDGAVYEPVDQSWSVMSPAPDVDFDPNNTSHGVVRGDEVLIFRGTMGLAWNWRTDAWRELAAAPSAVTGAAVYQRQVYATGADSSYDVGADSWTEEPKMRSSGAWHAEVVVSEEGLFVVRGSGETIVVSWLNDSGDWTVAPSGLRGWFSSAWSDGELFVAADRGSVKSFNPATNTWTEQPQLTTRLANGDPDLFVVDGRLIATSFFAIAEWGIAPRDSEPRYRIQGASMVQESRLWTYGILEGKPAFAVYPR